MSGQLISIVVPVYNEDESLDALVREVRTVAARDSLTVQVVLVDDGSSDRSWEAITALAAADPMIAGIRFRRNAGKAAALMAGFAAAQGDTVIMMDADLQDPPEEIPRLLAKLSEGHDLVSGWKRQRHDPWHKVYPSRVFNRIIGWVTGVHLHDHVCGLKCMRGQVAHEISIHGEFHRFIGVLAAARGFRVTEIPTLHRARQHGVGKYGFMRFAKGFLDVITLVCLTRFRWRPQHLIGMTGLLVILAGLVSAIPGLRLLSWLVLPLVSGLILIAIGLIGELVVADAPAADQYIISERVGWCAAAADGCVKN